MTDQIVSVTKRFRRLLADVFYPEGRVARECDKLTGLSNYSAFEEAHKRVERDHDLSVIIFDLNYFKKVNDVEGYLAGNEVLVTVANNLVEVAKCFGVSERSVFRFGGDEFVIICLKAIAPELMQAVEVRIDEIFAHNTIPVSISGSYGANLADAELCLQANKNLRKQR